MVLLLWLYRDSLLKLMNTLQAKCYLLFIKDAHGFSSKVMAINSNRYYLQKTQSEFTVIT